MSTQQHPLSPYAFKQYLQWGESNPNIVPVRSQEKRPGTLRHGITWKQYQTELIPQREYQRWFTPNDPCDAIGLLNGVRFWRHFDFDHCPSTDVVFEVLDVLGLPEDYEWVVETGSKHGYHIIFRCESLPSEHLLLEKKGEKGVYSSSGNGFDHLELRWGPCMTILPPSWHKSGHQYTFLNGNGGPQSLPAMISGDLVINAFLTVTHSDTQTNVPAIPEQKPLPMSPDWEKLKKKVTFKHVAEWVGWSYVEEVENYVGECPLHESDSGTCLRWKKTEDYFRCFHAGCKRGGDIISFVSLFKGTSNQESAKLLSEKFAPELSPNFIHSNGNGDGPPVVFWYMQQVRKDVWTPKLDRKAFLQWLEDSGYGLILIDHRIKFVKVHDYIVSDCLIEHKQHLDAKRQALAYCQQYKCPDIENMLLSGHNQYFTLSALNTLHPFDPPFYRDTQEEAHLFFKNCLVSITRHDVSIHPYGIHEQYIWENQILPYEYHGKYTVDATQIHPPEGEFFEFFQCITAKNIDELRQSYDVNEEKLRAFISAYGYLLYGWKDVTEAKAVICIDNTLGEIDDDGRTGKSLWCGSLKYLKNVQTEAGKIWNPKERFAFQNVDIDTQLIFVDDISRKFPFQALYPHITGGMSCEGKNLKPMEIPFEESARFMLTSNVPIQGDGESDKARQWVLPFSRFFSLAYTPKDKFNHRLFIDWEDQKWQQFFDFAIYAVHFYLTHGFIEYSDEISNETKLLAEIPEKVLDAFHNIPREEELEKVAIMDPLTFQGVVFRSPHQFTKWLKFYCRYWRGTADHEERLIYHECVVRENGRTVRKFSFKRRPKGGKV